MGRPSYLNMFHRNSQPWIRARAIIYLNGQPLTPTVSSEQRMKKLRGSGGYVMASVDDEEQRRGNLGGPDLFLAPIGRMDSERISRYFCNTCEKDYDGSPKIEFENPNETVADNLVLAERGQYVCTACDGTIAEYREFKKPDESGDVGLARPENYMQPDMQDAAAPAAPARETIAQDVLDSAVQSPAPPEAEAAQDVPDAEPAGITPIVGMAVFDQNGVRVGTARQVGVDSGQNVVLVVSRPDGSDTAIQWDEINKVGEIILIGAAPAGSQDACPDCGFANKDDAKFCEQCGNKI